MIRHVPPISCTAIVNPGTQSVEVLVVTATDHRAEGLGSARETSGTGTFDREPRVSPQRANVGAQDENDGTLGDDRRGFCHSGRCNIGR